jgi:hypothetical protein
MTDSDRFVCPERCRTAGGPGRDGQEGPVTYSFTTCVRCPVREERLLGGIRPAPRTPTVRIQARQDPGWVPR